MYIHIYIPIYIYTHINIYVSMFLQIARLEGSVAMGGAELLQNRRHGVAYTLPTVAV